MFDGLYHLLIESPLFILFITISLGYFIGKFRFKTFVLGGIAGSLIMGVIIGQIGIKMPSSIGTIFFALFIYAVGYQGGPQFFRSLNRETGVQLVSATITCVFGLLCVLIAAWVFNLDRGTAAGLGAGALTQSAMIGTASDAIAKLGLSAQSTQIMQANIAVGYAVCYIFGSFGPIIVLASIIPGIMKWDLRDEAKKLAKQMSGSQSAELEPGQFHAIPQVETRVYQIQPGSMVIGQTTASLFEKEVPKPKSLELAEEIREMTLHNKDVDGMTIEQFYAKTADKDHYGIFIVSVSRLGEELRADKDLVLRRGDDIKFIGRPADLDRMSSKLGQVISSAKLTDYISFGIGMSVGILIGMLTINIFGVSISIGSGGGCLLSGLVFGWLRSRHPQIGALPSGASNFLRDFGLAVFVATVGITAGPQALVAIKQYGMELFLLGVGVTIIPQIITFFHLLLFAQDQKPY